MSDYFVEDLFPLRKTSILCGPSGAGKSRWLLPTIADWLESKPVLGKKSFPKPCAYIACDRPSSSTYELIERLGLQERLKRMPVFSLMDRGKDFDYAKIPPMVKSTGAEVLFIEAFQVLIPNGEMGKYWHVLNFFRSWNQACELNNLTPFGTCHQPKTFEGEGYARHRDKIMGTAAWGAAAEGILTLDYNQPGNIDCSLRDMCVLPRNEKPWALTLDFDSKGYLLESKQDHSLGDMFLQQELVKQADGNLITTQQIEIWSSAKRVSRASMYRWLEKCPNLAQVKRGLYRYVANPPQPEIN